MLHIVFNHLGAVRYVVYFTTTFCVQTSLLFSDHDTDLWSLFLLLRVNMIVRFRFLTGICNNLHFICFFFFCDDEVKNARS